MNTAMTPSNATQEKHSVQMMAGTTNVAARDSAFVAITSEMMFGGGAGAGAASAAAAPASPSVKSMSTNIVYGEVQTCVQCGNTAKGKTDDDDGQFYCAECWKAFSV